MHFFYYEIFWKVTNEWWWFLRICQMAWQPLIILVLQETVLFCKGTLNRGRWFHLCKAPSFKVLIIRATGHFLKFWCYNKWKRKVWWGVCRSVCLELTACFCVHYLMTVPSSHLHQVFISVQLSKAFLLGVFASSSEMGGKKRNSKDKLRRITVVPLKR